MKKDEGIDPVEVLRERGLTCSRLKSMERREINEASEFRKVGFLNVAEVQEQTARKIKSLREKVCKLK